MFAVIKTGGKQYKVAKDTILEIEKLDAEAGDTVNFEEVLMLGGDSPVIGSPLIEGAAVSAEVLEQKRGDKVINYVKRRRKHSSQRRKGHRQYLTVVKITEIIAKGGAKPAKKAAAKPAAKKDDEKASKPAAKKADAKAEAAPAATLKAPKNLLKAPKGEPDDLTKISGVGPVLVEKLNAFGVYHFSQIAEWTKDDIAYADDQLSFKGRIERDNWIEQAKEFAKEAK